MSDKKQLTSIELERIMTDVENNNKDVIEDTIDSHPIGSEPADNELFTPIEELWLMFKQYVDYYVIGNEEMKKMVFHTFLGTVLTNKKYAFIDRAKRTSMRMGLFVICDSGNGKSELMGCVVKLIRLLGMESRLVLKDNEARQTGTTFLRKNRKKDEDEVAIIKGTFEKYDLIVQDEGSVFLKPGSYSENQTDYMQMAMDEKGTAKDNDIEGDDITPGGLVLKGMRLGDIHYHTHVTLLTGSYMFNEFNTAVMRKGLLQRMSVLYKVYTKKEEREIRIGINLLKLSIDPRRVKEMVESIQILVDKIPAYNEEESSKSEFSVYFNRKAVMKFNDNMESMFVRKIEGQFTDDKQKVLKTFYNRANLILSKIAAQCAVVNHRSIKGYKSGKIIATMKDMEYAETVYNLHLESVTDILRNVRGGGKDVLSERNKTVMNIISRSGNKIAKSRLIEELRLIKNEKMWDFGYDKTNELIMGLVEQGMTRIAKEGKIEYVYIVKS